MRTRTNPDAQAPGRATTMGAQASAPTPHPAPGQNDTVGDARGSWVCRLVNSLGDGARC